MVQEKDELLKKQVLYIGSAVPLDTAEGLEAVQKPLADRYPTDSDSKLEGILSYLTIVPGGITLQYDSDPKRIFFFDISGLKLCAAVRRVSSGRGAADKSARYRFVSLSDPEAKGTNHQRPAIFTFITRRSEGRKVLECHAFVCSSDKDAMDLVAVTSSVSRLYKEKTNNGVTAATTTTATVTGTPPGFHTTNSISASASAGTAAGGGGGGGGGGAAAAAATPADHPIRLVAGGDSASRRGVVAPEFYDPPPAHGYFYMTADSKIHSYTIERVVEEGGSERLRAISSNIPAATLPRGPVGERKPVYGGGPAPPSSGFMTLPPPPPPPPPPQGRHLIPVRVVPPPQAAPGRPRFFSPPPPMLRPHPMAVPPRYVMGPGGPEPFILMPHGPFMEPPPFVVMEPPSTRRRGSHSSHASSGSSSPGGGSPKEMNGQAAVNGTAADGSTDASSRPHTPPTDYDKGPRISRKEQFEHGQQQQQQQQQQRHLRQVNVDPALYASLPGGAPPMTPHPYGMYMMYPPRYLGYPPQLVMERPRSVPPTMTRSTYKDGKKSGGKSKKDKKKKQKKSAKHRNHHGAPSDVSTDSMGYTSEVGPGGDYPRMPREFRLFENQFKHEKAFSKSLKEEGSRRGAPEAQNPGNAYSLNEQMSRRAKESDFNLY